MKIVFLGNFSVPFSTESHHKWTWEKMGHQVLPLQENKVTTQTVVEACKGADLFQWTHTHNWLTAGALPEDEMVNRIRAMGVPSFSYHLDLYWGLNLLDARELNLGKHASFRLDHFFSTDGGNHDWKSKGINHTYLPPGVVEYGCYMGTPTPAYKIDVGFVGSEGYHPEYPFRPKLIKALREHYGPRFRVYSSFREKALNDAYASIGVAVGDYCFAGIPRYWSDRVPETCGRGGFLLAPATEGLDIRCAKYKAQDIDDCIRNIDHWLKPENAEQRDLMRYDAHEQVKEAHTYTNRLSTILKVMGLA